MKFQLKMFFKKWNYKKLRNIALVLILVLTVFFSLKSALESKKVGEKIYTEMNNYQIFKHVFFHTLSQKNLYKSYPEEYFDHNHYGPFFALVIAPFTVFPDAIGVVFWGLLQVLFLLFAFSKIIKNPKHQFFVLLLMINDFANNALNNQMNGSIAAMLILSFFYVEKKKDHWATFFIFLGAFIKIYTLVGLVFFLFSKRKIHFIKSAFFWMVVFFVTPMFISSFDFITQSYADWFLRLGAKNTANLHSPMQHMDLAGFIEKITGKNLQYFPFLIFGTLCFLLPLLRIRQYKNTFFRLSMLILSLIYIVIFSSGSESPTYIIAVSGISIWAIFFLNKKNTLGIVFFVIAIFGTILSSTDFFPPSFRHKIIYPYKIKVIGASLIWFYQIYKLIFTTFAKKNNFENHSNCHSLP